jgi:pyruvate formate lyase activating enzyme
MARELGYSIKLDTNGYHPQELEALLDNGLIDYVAMDIKNSPSKYAQTSGLTALDFSRITDSVRILKDFGGEYEFRTTVAPELHCPQDIEEILRFTGGGKRYTLQPFHQAPTLSGGSFSSTSSEILAEMVQILEQGFKHVTTRT